MGKNSLDSNLSQPSGLARGSLAVWFFGLVLGACGGAAVALLTAPKPGKEIRGALKQTAYSMPDRVNELVDDSLDFYASALNYLKLLMEEQTLRLKRAIAAGKLAAAKKREELELEEGRAVLPFQHR